MFRLKSLSVLLIYLTLNWPGVLLSQSTLTDSLEHREEEKKQMDVGDLLRHITKKKIIIKDTLEDKRRRLFYTPILYPGYALVTGYLVGLANNISFYTHMGKDAKISNILIENIYTQYKQYINIVRSNIWLKHERFNLQGDWRYYKFPTNTFGLGSKTSLSDRDPVDYSHLRVNEIIMGKIASNIFIGTGINLDYHWNIQETANAGSVPTDMTRYGYNRTSLSSGITLNMQFDNRLNGNNPSNGTYANLQVRNNLKILGSNTNWQSVILDVRHYIPLSRKTHNVLALWTYNWFTLSGTPPYFDLPSSGWDTQNNMAREYVEGRFRGLNLMYAEAEYRFRITKNELLGGVVFSDISTLTEWPTNSFERANVGAGLGLRIKLNKFSRTNLCIDYGIGTSGAKGFSFNINEVF